MIRRLILVVVLGVIPWTAARALAVEKPVPAVERVLIISIDGLRPDLMLRAQSPNLRRLFENGSYTFWALTTIQSITTPSHVSMLTGVTPEAHGILWNSDLPLSEPVYPRFPTLFELAKKRGLTTAMVAGKSKFDVLERPGAIDWTWLPTESAIDDGVVIEHAERILREHRPQVMVMHLAEVDIVGHRRGWGSDEQMAAVERADACVGVMLEALEELDLLGSTLIIVSADHGGAGWTHGPDDPRSRTIPWIVHGPGIRRNYDLTRHGDLIVETFDTFATACAMLGIPVERQVRGKFVKQILADRELLQSSSTKTAVKESGVPQASK